MTAEIRLADGFLLCHAGVADTFRTRGIGLLGRKSLAEDVGLLIQPCTSVHTMFMCFPIDVIYLDKNDTVVKTVRNMKTFRMSMGGREAKKVLELPAGTLDRHGIVAGTPLKIRGV